jgi:ABC-type Mn2+/Zn2+ transport system permease subunit
VPGVVGAFLTRGSLTLWGGATALLAAWAIALLVRRLKLGGDPAIAIVFSAAFALGLAMISATRSYVTDLTEILFGSVLAVSALDLWTSAAVAAAALVALYVLFRPLVFASFDPVGARAVGLPLEALDLGLYALIALAVVAGLSAVGALLVTALLVVPAATARVLVRDVPRQMAVSGALGCAAGWIGLYASYHWDLASGGAIVLAAVGLFGLGLAASPRHGLPARWRRRRMRGAAPARAAA